jgi:hypothetical protein
MIFPKLLAIDGGGKITRKVCRGGGANMRVVRYQAIVWFLLLLLGWAIQPAQAMVADLSQANKEATYSLDTITINNIGMFVTNSGSFAWDVATGNPGLIFPLAGGTGTKTAVFASGLWIGAKVNGEIRIALSEYSDEYVPGVMADSTFSPDNSRFRIYKIYRGDTISSDYLNWPVGDGAPVDSNGKPLFLGDETLWSVYNDADPSAHSNNAGSTSPLGVEVQQTTFGFNREDPLGNVVFVKFRVINKGPNRLDSTYISLWSDPDLGGAMDDYVGCDTTLSLGFCYNATNNDELYGSTPPCVGYDFFQGPIVPGTSADTAYVSGIPKPGYRNLPMVSFNKYINGTDPTSATETYNYMQGLNSDGTVQTNPITGQPTTYTVSGDPVTGKGWLDTNPADRRFMESAGPFTMAPGDTQEVVAAIVLGQGADRLTSITAMEYNDRFAQSAFDNNFVLPQAPKAPVVTATPLDRKLVLAWGLDSENQPGDYPFEGYNVYQGASAAGPWKRIATYDLNDGIALIFDDVFDVNVGVVINEPVQFGSDFGLVHFIEISDDKWRATPLRNGTPYYFKVGAYSYDEIKTPKTLEKTVALTVIPQSPIAGTDYGIVNESLVHSPGDCDGGPMVRVVDPSMVTGHVYRFTFTQPDTASPELVWNFMDVTTANTILEDQTDYSAQDNYLLVDGLSLKMSGSYNPPITYDSAVQTVDADPSDAGLTLWGDATLFGDPTGKASEEYGGGDSNAVYLQRDIELRFTGVFGIGRIDTTIEGNDTTFDTIYATVSGGSWASLGKVLGSDDLADYELVRIPFEVWDVDKGNERQVNCVFYDRGHHESTWEIENRDYIIPVLSDYDSTALKTGADPFATWFIFFTTTSEWSTGDVFRVYYSNPITKEDVFTLNTTKPTRDDMTEAKETLDKVNVVPNPYYNSSTYEPNPFNRVIKFNHLPRICKIRIFNLAGDLVRTLDKNDDQSYLNWDVKTEQGLPVASGIYIYYIEAPGIGTKVGKMAIFTEKERLNTY